MRCNPRKEEQRWCQWNLQIAMMSAGKDRMDKGVLEQFKSLVQPTPQFLEHLRKTMPMSESQLNMMTSMYDVMYRWLTTLEVLFKDGQRAVDKYTNSILVGDNKKKAAALFKAKSKDGPPTKKRARCGGGGGGGPPTKVQATSRRRRRTRIGHHLLNVANATGWATRQRTVV
jgi:hypothetical protein